jgi:ribonucleotide monophosphatase NagD (HAD superfamily)
MNKQKCRVLRQLKQENRPFLMLTNGGGMVEDAKAAQLSKLLDCEVQPEQVILSHTPMKVCFVEIHGVLVFLIHGSKLVDSKKKKKNDCSGFSKFFSR